VSASGKTATGSGNSGQQRITPTLVALIVVFTLCVGPSGLLDFFREHVLQTGAQASRAKYFAYQTATVIINCLFLVNFAVNFVLYCVVNVQFRRTARDVIILFVTSRPLVTSSAARARLSGRRERWRTANSHFYGAVKSQFMSKCADCRASASN